MSEEELKSNLLLAEYHAFRGDIDSFSKIEHLLSSNIFLKSTDEENDFFEKFYYLQSLSRICLKNGGLINPLSKPKIVSKIINPLSLRWAIVCKGEFNLAHTDFLEEFLYGLRFIKKISMPFLICIDSHPPKTLPYSNLKMLPLYKLKSTKDRVMKYIDFVRQCDLSIWFACSQNISLFMGNNFCNKEAIWTMKHLKMRPGSVNFLLTGGSCKGARLDGPAIWNHGRSLSFSMRKLVQTKREQSRPTLNKNHVKMCTVVRSEKLKGSGYWKIMYKLLTSNPDVELHIASSADKVKILSYAQQSIDSLDGIKNQIYIHRWQKNPASFINKCDIYVDTFPMGSGLMGQYSVILGLPYIALNTPQTLKSSFASNLKDFNNSLNLQSLGMLGVASTIEEYYDLTCLGINAIRDNQLMNTDFIENQRLYADQLKELADSYAMAADFSDIILKNI